MLSRPGVSWLGRVCVLLAALLCWPTAHAGALYRCTGSSGELVYSSSPSGYRHCRQEGMFRDEHAARGLRVAPSSLAAVTGSVETSASKVEPSPDAVASLLGVQAAVETSAHPLPPVTPVAAGRPGGWSYRDSPQSDSGALAVASAPAAGDRVLRGAVYRVIRADGTVEYTNVAPRGQRAATILFSYISTCVACNLRSPINWDTVTLNFDAYAGNIRAASLEFGVDEALLRAIIHAESAFNPHALSIKGAQGLMQLMPATAGDMGVRDAFDAGQNIRGGARYLSQLLKNFNGDERLAAAAYNAGANAVMRYNGVPPYAETQVYVERVGVLRKRYGQLIHSPLADRGPG